MAKLKKGSRVRITIVEEFTTPVDWDSPKEYAESIAKDIKRDYDRIKVKSITVKVLSVPSANNDFQSLY